MKRRSSLFRPRPTLPDDVVVAEERETLSGHRLGIVTLNSEKTLNALSLEMIDRLVPIIMDWRDRDEVVAVVVRGAGDRAFCAGGDLQALYYAMKRNREAGQIIDGTPDTFFSKEYRLDYMMHDFNKPIISLGDGIIMGGGLGLFIASEFRVVTERTRLAMPEVTIGLFPDAGGTWIMRNLRFPAAQFLAMTGASLNTADCMKTRLGTHAIPSDKMAAVIDALADMHYVTEDKNSRRIKRRLNRLTRLKVRRHTPSNLRKHRWLLHKHLSKPKSDVKQLVAEIRSMQGKSEWIDQAIATMNRSCPTSLGIVHEQLRRCRDLEMADGFRLELILAVNCSRHPDFEEGIRATIIDKDSTPSWRYPSVEELPKAYIMEHFEPPWPSNPLHDIEDCRTIPMALRQQFEEEAEKKSGKKSRKSKNKVKQ